jgi:hypothetical protein
MPFCATCGEYTDAKATLGTLGAHRCPPTWDWRCDSTHAEDEWEIASVRARDPEMAAERAAELYDVDERDLIRTCQEVTIELRLTDRPDKVLRCAVRGEAVPHYYARALTKGNSSVRR